MHIDSAVALPSVAGAVLAPYASYRPAIEGRIPAGRFARPEEIAAVVAAVAPKPVNLLLGWATELTLRDVAAQ
jgi:NAD(P)-dependent dehydrogenase (short-subunit alcohol dehydrogenase family)